jgi:hypothetical protein
VSGFAFGELVEVLTAGEVVDPYSGEPVVSWDTPTVVAVEGCGVEPRPSTEPVADARNATVSGFTLYLPADVAVTAGSRVRVRGKVHEVLGEPAVWRSPITGWSPGVVVQTQRVEG